MCIRDSSPGAKPTQPRLPGVGIDKLFTLRTVEDTFRIKKYINKNHPKSVVLAGGGFIGLELAENLRGLGMDVTIVQRPKQLMNPFDPDMASMIHNEMRKHGIKDVYKRQTLCYAITSYVGRCFDLSKRIQ